jgi:hypothetical protein
VPLIIFDIRHYGSNIQGINQLWLRFSQAKPDIMKIDQVLLLPANVFSQFWYEKVTNVSFLHTYCPFYALGIRFHQLPLLQFGAACLILLYIINIFKYKKKKELLVVELLLVYYFGILIYGILFNKPVFEHYLAGLLPIFAFITARYIVRFWIGGFFILIVFISLNLLQFFRAQNPYGLKTTQQAIDWSIGVLKGEAFALDSLSECFRYNGIRYLYEIKDHPPAISFIDPQFFWLYRNKPATTFPKKIIIFTDEKIIFKQPIINKKDFGSWQVYILDNFDLSYQINGL